MTPSSKISLKRWVPAVIFCHLETLKLKFPSTVQFVITGVVIYKQEIIPISNKTFIVKSFFEQSFCHACGFY